MKKLQFYRKKPGIIQAIQWTGENYPQVKAFCPNIYTTQKQLKATNYMLFIPDKSHTIEGCMCANPGDFIIRGTEGEFSLHKEAAFTQTYEHISKAKALFLKIFYKFKVII